MIMRTISVLYLLGLVFGTVMAAAEEATSLYVSPMGKDAWTGTLADPNAEGTDGPFATVAGARDALRSLRAVGKAKGAVTVYIRDGVYFLKDPLTFTPEDGGSEKAPVTYKAYPGEQPVLSGGVEIVDWKQEGNFWTAKAPEPADKALFGGLWVNGKRATRARTPNAAHEYGDYPEEGDTFYVQDNVMEKDGEGKEAKSATRFVYQANDLKSWDSLSDATVVVYHSWETGLMRVKGLDETNHVVEFTGSSVWPYGYWGVRQRYYVENLLEGLDQPGEWYLNGKTGMVYYIPRPGEDMAKADVIAPVLKQLVVLAGKPAEGKFVDYLHFDGLRFHHTEYPLEPQGHGDAQAAASVNALFEAVGARNCLIENCEIAHTGNYGVWFRTGAQHNRLVHSELVDLGAGGVRLGETKEAPSEQEAAGHNEVENCFIHDGGRIFRGAVGVWIGQSSYNTLAHNEICDFRYTGISVGWSWGYAPTSANHNRIEYNHVYEIGKGQLNDMGGIYTLGISPGTVIRYNTFHDVLSYPPLYGGWGIYFDEGSSGILAENNIVWNTLTGGFHQHYGKENRVQNNIFAFSHGGQLIRSRQEGHISFFFERNIVYFNNNQLLGSNWSNKQFVMDNNCYWDASGANVDFKGKSLKEWQADGFDQHSIVVDPGFVNVDAADFTLKPDSPVLALGFKPIDLSQTGLYGEPEWVSKPKQIEREPFRPPLPPKPEAVADGFETTEVGSAPKDATVSEEKDGTIRVSTDTASEGARSLCVTDAADLTHPYDPYIFYTPHICHGTAWSSFSLRLEPGINLVYQWRDAADPYRVGPSLRFDGDGTLVVGGKTLVKLPLSEWVEIRVECPVGMSGTGTFTLQIRLAGNAEIIFDNLACDNPEFRRVEWVGFIANGTNHALCYIDDLKIDVR